MAREHDMDLVRIEMTKAPEIEQGRTRHEEQQHVDSLFMFGKIERDEWGRRTDELSNIGLWVAEGKIRTCSAPKKSHAP